MPAPVRGSWEVHEAIKALWDAPNDNLSGSSLDQLFRAEWGSAAPGFFPLNDMEARPQTPLPYCVYELFPEQQLNHSTGKDDETQIRYFTMPCQFRIHARSTTAESGKAIAKRMAMLIAAVFNPPTKLAMTNDRHISTIPGPDFAVREGDDEWSWVLTYDWRIEGTLNAAT